MTEHPIAKDLNLHQQIGLFYSDSVFCEAISKFLNTLMNFKLQSRLTAIHLVSYTRQKKKQRIFQGR
jgi:hypothetical protein